MGAESLNKYGKSGRNGLIIDINSTKNFVVGKFN
jgi:hypothetical protein